MQVKDFFSSSAKLADLTSLRRRRVIQISAVTGFGLFASSLVARGITFDIFLLGLFSLIVTGSLAYKYYVTT
ncbi:GGDEF-domain containing protein, partial [Alteromonas sp. MCA-1]|nr:GGDEF-domain containing protein [Alteromonas sp. MCA-1]